MFELSRELDKPGDKAYLVTVGLKLESKVISRMTDVVIDTDLVPGKMLILPSASSTVASINVITKYEADTQTLTLKRWGGRLWHLGYNELSSYLPFAIVKVPPHTQVLTPPEEGVLYQCVPNGNVVEYQGGRWVDSSGRPVALPLIPVLVKKTKKLI